MIRAASYLNLLAFGVSLVGVFCFFLTFRPSGGREWLASAADFGPAAFGHPMVAIAAAVAVVATVAARVLDRPLPIERQKKIHALDPAVAQRSLTPLSEAVDDRYSREQLRLRLEGLMRGGGDMIAFVDELLAGAIRCRASDIHIQPREGSTRLALRIEGELTEVALVAETLHAKIVRRLKVLARLVPYKTDEPQDGRFAIEMPASPVDVRVSVLPTQHGEKVVLRLVRPGAGLLELEELGMGAALERAFKELLREPQGLVVLTGPTGSGKTTTLYSALNHLHETRGGTTNIATIEDPVEIELPFLSQTQVDRAKGLDFSAGLRAVLRQDPNVLLLGEIRDSETASIAIQAGLTGHLILTSLHADSTAGVFARLIDVGVEPFLVGSSMLACLSQRLVRRLCPRCRRPARAGREAAARLAEHGISVDGLEFYSGEGCRACNQTGHAGRTAIFEMLRMTPALRHRIASKIPTQEIEAAAIEAGMKPLLATAVEAAASGRISLDEALRVAA